MGTPQRIEDLALEAEDLVNFDEKGNVVVKKNTDASSKLVARRAIEAHSERKRLDKDIDEYYWGEV